MTLPGKPYPYGPTEYPDGINFAIYINNPESVSLCIFEEGNTSVSIAEHTVTNRTGDVWHIFIKNLKTPLIYSFKINGAYILDPFAKAVHSQPHWNDLSDPKEYKPFGKAISSGNFDWQGVESPNIHLKSLIVYEMHVRGFTQDPSSGVKNQGTYLGIIEKIPYLKELGVNAIELMPVFEFNEREVSHKNPNTDEQLVNYFGYSHVNFFAPMNRYSSRSEKDQAVLEFKTMVRELHRNGIEVILDVVYNHTSEGNGFGPHYSFKGLDKNTYYMIEENGNFYNFSGTGNTFNCNNPIALDLILQSLRYWVTEMHVDGFRFDLATILKRDSNGAPFPYKAPVVEAISKDPILSKTKLIAEAWDCGGLYQVGGFYPGDRWSEWNGLYRDVTRKFIKGTTGYKQAFATALSGSQNLYGWRGSPYFSINFVTAHDGFSLCDLVSYNEKHNIENGESNRDGFDHNESWNCGAEGQTDDQKIVALRERQMRNFILTLMLSQGIPMLLMGDEYGHTRLGNNNTWCQDNRLNWFLWDELSKRQGFHRFVKSIIQLRKSIPLLHRDSFLSTSDVSWHGLMPNHPDWHNDNRFIAFTLNVPDKYPELYVAFNAGYTPQTITLPRPALPITGGGRHWEWVVNTHNESPNDFYEEGKRPRVSDTSFEMQPYSAIVLISVPD